MKQFRVKVRVKKYHDYLTIKDIKPDLFEFDMSKPFRSQYIYYNYKLNEPSWFSKIWFKEPHPG